jgi:hypothetical protein
VIPQKPSSKRKNRLQEQTTTKTTVTTSTLGTTEPNKEETVAATSWRHKAQKIYKIALKVLVRTGIPEVFLIATLCMSRYTENADFSYPSEVVLNIVLLGVLVACLFQMLLLILRRVRAAHIAALLLAYGLYGYTYTFPRFHQWGDKIIPNSATAFAHTVLQLVLLAIIFGVVGFGVDRLLSLKHLRNIPLFKIIIFAVCFIFVVEVGKVGLRMWTIRADLSYKEPAISLQQNKKAATSKPDVYYLLFDRYASSTTLKNVYNYDNTPLLKYLDSQGFVSRENAYANYPFTMQSVSSTLAMGYHTAIGKEFQNDAKGFQAAFPYRAILDNPPIVQALKSNGYSYNQVSSWWDFTRNVPSATTEPTKSFRLQLLGKSFWLTDLQRDILNKSILSPLLLKGVAIGHTTVVQYQLDRNPAQNFEAQMEAVKAVAISSTQHKQPQFTFAHILSPHEPYIFDANGNTPDYDDNRTDDGIDESVKYINQLTYINKRIEDLISTIRTHDPHAAIVLQADEGPYPKQFRGTLMPGHYYDPINLPVSQMRQKFGILASYYMPDTDPQTVTNGIPSSVDSFRFVLSNYLGYKLPTLPDCQFAVGDKYNLYNYQLVTGALKGSSNPESCQQYK